MNDMQDKDYPPLITASQITHSFNQQKLLDQIDLSIHANEYTTIIGLNGSGKSTLLRILLKLLPCHQGTITHAAHLRIGYVPQRWLSDGQLPITVYAFLMLNLPKGCTTNLIDQQIERWQLNAFAYQSIHTLSGGQWQRLLLARALMSDPQLLALDEPTQGLDLQSQHDFYQQIAQLHKQGTSILMISHDLAHAMSYSQRVVALAEGQICCQGKPHELLNNPNYQQRFVCAHQDNITTHTCCGNHT
jgi:zinc transport system ATP-binding protein